jgi:propanol-preferring alcohol dehydrogenase
MRAAVVRSFDRPLALEDLPIPQPGPGQVLVRVETCGLCHTDIHAARGEWPVKPSPPFIPGHEGVGIVERLGAGEKYGLEPGAASPSTRSATRATWCASPTASTQPTPRP